MNAHDFHFPDVCFIESIDKKFIITIIPEKEPAYYQMNFGELPGARRDQSEKRNKI